ncbi:MAG: proton-conducting transporter membrane subunit, partial [Gemmatimonadaceae bacterium]
HPWLAAVMIVLLSVIFIGIAQMILEMVYGRPEPGEVPAERVRERPWLVLAPAALATLTLVLGVYLPSRLAAALSSAAQTLGGHAP